MKKFSLTTLLDAATLHWYTYMSSRQRLTNTGAINGKGAIHLAHLARVYRVPTWNYVAQHYWASRLLRVRLDGSTYEG